MSARRSGRRYCKPSEHTWGPNPIYLFGVCRVCGEIRQEPAPEQLDTVRHELLGLDVLVTVFERLAPEERRRALSYLADRFGAPERVEVKPTATPERIVDAANRLGALRAARDEILRRAEVSPDVSPQTWVRWVRELFEGLGDPR